MLSAITDLARLPNQRRRRTMAHAKLSGAPSHQSRSAMSCYVQANPRAGREGRKEQIARHQPMGGPTHILERADPAERRRRISSPSHLVLDTSPLPNRNPPFLNFLLRGGRIKFDDFEITRRTEGGRWFWACRARICLVSGIVGRDAGEMRDELVRRVDRTAACRSPPPRRTS